jgi:hypothetical protein
MPSINSFISSNFLYWSALSFTDTTLNFFFILTPHIEKLGKMTGVLKAYLDRFSKNKKRNRDLLYGMGHLYRQGVSPLSI